MVVLIWGTNKVKCDALLYFDLNIAINEHKLEKPKKKKKILVKHQHFYIFFHPLSTFLEFCINLLLLTIDVINFVTSTLRQAWIAISNSRNVLLLYFAIKCRNIFSVFKNKGHRLIPYTS